MNLVRFDDFIEAVYADLGESPPGGIVASMQLRARSGGRTLINEGFAVRYRSNDGELSFDGILDPPLNVQVLDQEDFPYGAALTMTKGIVERHDITEIVLY